MRFCDKCGKALGKDEVCTCTSAEATTQEATVTEEMVAETSATETAADEQAVAEVAPTTESKFPIDKKMLAIIGAAAAAVVVFILVIVLIASGSKGYMSPVEDFMAAINKQNTDPVKVNSTLMPDFAADLYAQCHKKYMVSEDFADLYEDSVEYLEDYYDDCNDEYDKWKLSFEMKKASKMDEDDLEDIQDYLDDYYDNLEDVADNLEDILDDADEIEDLADDADISESQFKAIMKSNLKYVQAYEEMKVTAGYEVKGKFIVKSGKDEFDTETVEFRVVKINGDWTYWGLTSGNIDFDDDEDNCFSFIANYLSGKKLYRGF